MFVFTAETAPPRRGLQWNVDFGRNIVLDCLVILASSMYEDSLSEEMKPSEGCARTDIPNFHLASHVAHLEPATRFSVFYALAGYYRPPLSVRLSRSILSHVSLDLVLYPPLPRCQPDRSHI